METIKKFGSELNRPAEELSSKSYKNVYEGCITSLTNYNPSDPRTHFNTATYKGT